MHIKQVIIQGFKTYKDRTEVPPFDPGHNVVCTSTCLAFGAVLAAADGESRALLRWICSRPALLFSSPTLRRRSCSGQERHGQVQHFRWYAQPAWRSLVLQRAAQKYVPSRFASCVVRSDPVRAQRQLCAAARRGEATPAACTLWRNARLHCASSQRTLAAHRRSRVQEGAGRDIMSASVEIIFDNKDMRFPVRAADMRPISRLMTDFCSD